MDPEILDRTDKVTGAEVEDDEFEAAQRLNADNFRSAWRVVLAIVVLALLAFLAYPLLQGNSSSPGSETPAVTGVSTPPASPLVTPQAGTDSAQAQFEAGNAYAQAQQWEQAVAAYQKAIELDPNFQAAYVNLGVVYYRLDQLDLAASQYKKALELNPNDGDVAYNLGALSLRQALLAGPQADPELINGAISQIQHALELDPKLAEPHFALGVAYSALNRREEAIQEFETFLAVDTGRDPQATEEARRQLEALRHQQ